MSKFYANFSQEVNRYFCLRNMIIFFCLIIIVTYSTHFGVEEHTISMSQEKYFRKIAEFFFSKMIDYERYSVIGIDILSLPAASGVLFANPLLVNLSANINPAVNLHIYNNCQSKNIFKAHSLLQFRPSSIILLLGSLLALFVGYEALRDLEYLKFIASAASETIVYATIIVSRFLMLVIGFLSILLFSVCIMAIQGIHLTHSDFTGLAGFLMAAVLMLAFFFLLGTVIGHAKSSLLGFGGLLVSWIVLILMSPGMFDSIIEEKANEITSYYKVYNDKLTVVSDFEKKAKNKNLQYGKTSMAVLRQEVEGYINNENRDIEAVDEQHKEEIKQIIIVSNNLYNLLPSTFYLSTANEASSRGYQNFLDFYTYLQLLRSQFLRFWIDRVYYNDPKIMVNFVKGDENIFKAKSQLPFNFRQGVFINLGYCIILLFLSFFLYIRALFPAPKTAKALKKVYFKVNVPGVFTEIKSKGIFITYFLNVFFGRIKRFTGVFILWGENIVNRDKKDFLFIPNKNSIPGDLSVKSFLYFFKRLLKPTEEVFQKLTADLDKTILKKNFAEIDDFNKAMLLLTVARMKKFPVLIFDNIATGIPHKDLEKIRALIQDFRYNDITIFNFDTNDSFIVYNPDNWKTFYSENGEYCDIIQKQHGPNQEQQEPIGD